MERILEDPYFIALIAIESLAAITALFCFRKYKHSKMRYFLFFLIYVAICTWLMTYPYSVRFNGVLSFLETTRWRANYWLGTLTWDVLAMLFYSWFFTLFMENRSYVKLIRFLALVYALFSIILIYVKLDRFFIANYDELNLASTVLLVSTLTFYFIDLLQSDRLLLFYKSNIFYIASILFIWKLVTVPIHFYEPYFTLNDPAYVELRGMIYFYVNLFMYLGYTLILIFGTPRQKAND